MKKSTIIATCLVNSNMISRMEQAEQAVEGVFDDEYPGLYFMDWNQDVDERTAQHIISTVGRASFIKVDKFIADLGLPKPRR